MGRDMMLLEELHVRFPTASAHAILGVPQKPS
jgi:hypothetical protein